jgi:hypothetical protein
VSSDKPLTDREILRFADPEQEQARKAILEVLQNTTDNRAKLKAAEIVLGHERDLHKHEHPQKQQHTIDGELNIKIAFPEKAA